VKQDKRARVQESLHDISVAKAAVTRFKKKSPCENAKSENGIESLKFATPHYKKRQGSPYQQHNIPHAITIMVQGPRLPSDDDIPNPSIQEGGKYRRNVSNRQRGADPMFLRERWQPKSSGMSVVASRGRGECNGINGVGRDNVTFSAAVSIPLHEDDIKHALDVSYFQRSLPRRAQSPAARTSSDKLSHHTHECAIHFLLEFPN
jgi:hypothetical protein